MVLKNDILEYFDSLARKSEGPYTVYLALCNADCQYVIMHVITPYSLCCDVAKERTAKELCFVVCFLLGNSPASDFYMATFRNTVFSIFIGR